MNIWKWILGILYPKTCCFCEKVSETDICTECRKKIEYVKEPRCKKCGKPIRYEEEEFCHDCRSRRHFFEQGKSIWIHKKPVSSSIYRFKYQNRRIYGEFYAKEMYRIYGNLIRDWEIDVIVPVPLHKKRKRTRGYNQAEIIAKHLGNLTGIETDTKSVVRRKYTRPQKELNDRERQKNLKEAFEVTSNWRKAKNVLIIDDIYTTGSTIDAIAKTLKEAGTQKVWFLTISIGQGF